MMCKKKIFPKDILVVVKDIEKYKPFIQFVFLNFNRDTNISFCISKIKKKHSKLIFLVFLKFLEFNSSYLSLDKVFSLLEYKIVRKKFKIQIKDIFFLKKYFLVSEIETKKHNKWNRKSYFKEYLNYCKIKKERFFMEYCFGKKRIWNNTFYYKIQKKQILIGNFIHFLEKIIFWKKVTNSAKNIVFWKNFVKKISIDFFYIDNKNSQKEFFLLQKCWNSILEDIKKSKYEKKISLEILKEEYLLEIHKKKIEQKFDFSAINFCSFIAMRSISFKVVYLLGMNEEYPKKEVPISFDLINETKRSGDRNTNEEYKNLFLDYLISAKEKLFISYIENKKFQNKRSHSIFIDELVDYIKQNFYFSSENNKNNNLVKDASIKKKLFYFYKENVFSKNFLFKNKKIEIFSKEWNKFFNFKKKKYHFLANIYKKEEKIIEIDKIKDFYKDPIKFWFKNTLKTYLYEKKEIFKKEDSFLSNKSILYKIRKKILYFFIKRRNIKNILFELQYLGIFPNNNFSLIIWNSHVNEIKKFFQKIKKYLKFFKMQKYHNYRIEIAKKTILGGIKFSKKFGIFRFIPENIKIKKLVLFWINHLIYCYIGGKGKSRIFGIDKIWIFSNLSKNQSKKLLKNLIIEYHTRIKNPGHLIYKIGGEWWRKRFDFKNKRLHSSFRNKRDSYNSIKKIWKGNYFLLGESKNLYTKKVIFQFNKKNLKKVILCTKKVFFPIFLHSYIKNLDKI